MRKIKNVFLKIIGLLKMNLQKLIDILLLILIKMGIMN